MHNTETLQEKQKPEGSYCARPYVVRYNIIRVNMFYIAIWPILLLVIYCIMDEVSEIDYFSEILIRIDFSQVVIQL